MLGSKRHLPPQTMPEVKGDYAKLLPLEQTNSFTDIMQQED